MFTHLSNAVRKNTVLATAIVDFALKSDPAAEDCDDDADAADDVDDEDDEDEDEDEALFCCFFFTPAVFTGLPSAEKKENRFFFYIFKMQ